MPYLAKNLSSDAPTRLITPRRYRLLAGGIICVVALIALAETIGFADISRRQADQNVFKADMREIRLLQQSLVDAETGVRGFLITNQPTFLEPYYFGTHEMMSIAPERITELDAVTHAQSGAGSKVFSDTVRRLREVWNAEISKASSLSSRSPEAGQALTEGKNLMDRLRVTVAETMTMKEAHVADLDRTIGTERSVNLTLILAGALLATAAVAYAFDQSIRDAVRRDRAVSAAAEASRRTTILSAMAEMLQSAVDREDANEVLRASATQLLPGISGALYVFNNSRDRLDLSTQWSAGRQTNAGAHNPDHISPASCWALKRGKPHCNTGGIGSLRCLHCSDDAFSLEIPMSARGELYGLLLLTSTEHDAEQRLTSIHQPASAVADAMSLALSSIALREQLRNQALRDPLTGLYNRRFMEEMLVRSVQDTERKRAPLSVVMIDLDHFKLLNDRHGHPTGDAVLKHVANAIMGLVRATDVACRIGGEELVILMPDCGLELAVAKAEKIRAAIELLSEDGRIPPVTASLGVASRPETTLTAEDLLTHADAALYAAKQQGRNTVALAPSRPQTPTLVVAEQR